MEKVAIKRALISVSDKTGLESLLEALQALGVVLVSQGGRIVLLLRRVMRFKKFLILRNSQR